MKQLILRDDSGKETLVRDVPDNIDVFDIVIRSEFLATKLWSEEDVKMELIEAGYEGCDGNIAEVVNTGHLKSLGDCTDSEWEIIRYAISVVKDRLVEMDTEKKPECPCSCEDCGHSNKCPCDNAIPCSASCENIADDWSIKIGKCLREHCDTADIVIKQYLDGYKTDYFSENGFPEDYSEKDIENFIECFGEEIDYPYERKVTYYEIEKEPDAQTPVVLNDEACAELEKETKASVEKALNDHINQLFFDEQHRIGNLLRCGDLPGDIDPMSCIKLEKLQEQITELVTSVLMCEIPGSCFEQ